MTKTIEINQLNISDTNGKPILKDVSFSIPKGASVGIVGESGSGKSITMKFLLGQLPPTLNASYQGLNLLGSDPYQLSDQERRQLIGRNVGYIPQNTVEYLHPLIKIQTQLIDGYLTHKLGTKAEAIQKAIQLLEYVEITDPQRVLQALPQELSGGMRQRVNIALAMMCDPELIIADEPTTALDAEVQYQVMQLLKQLHEETQNTMVIISHDMSLIKAYCDYVIVIYNGVIQEIGATQEIFIRPQAEYTQALLSVILRLDQDPNEALKDISYYYKKGE
ncbi:ABC transporter ATP-binding protein [Fundicoccus culcitae]|uniref:ABC transporter ATP-binding protein n=1 Tax=Fundicoccus culcitae TaxID=2969821 RepID=A0ABY5P4I0_9LACT|nr:ABC transporter ATP-binding protein [Fundicoccus culcitae]UUX33604.1 ABC transporter ATP-binding protein [Fundicoccus culcitae]